MAAASASASRSRSVRWPSIPSPVLVARARHAADPPRRSSCSTRCIVVGYRLRRRRSLLAAPQRPHRCTVSSRSGWTPVEAVVFLVRRAVPPVGHRAVHRPRRDARAGSAAPAPVVVLLVVGIEAGRARLEREPAARAAGLGVDRRRAARGVWLVVATAPLALAANDTVDLMQRGREAATPGAQRRARRRHHHRRRVAFDQAARVVRRRRATSSSRRSRRPASRVPFLASNVRAARTLADIGTDLANAGESLTAAVDPDALEVVDGRLPVEEVRKITPQLEHGAAVARRRPRPPRRPARRPVPRRARCATRSTRCTASSPAPTARPARRGRGAARAGDLRCRRRPHLPARGAEQRRVARHRWVHRQLRAHHRPRRQARRRRHDPHQHVERSGARARRRHLHGARTTTRAATRSTGPTRPCRTSTSRPTSRASAQVLMSLAPAGRAARRSTACSRSTRPGSPRCSSSPARSTVPDWPTPIDSGNVVNVTLRDAYAAFAEHARPRRLPRRRRQGRGRRGDHRHARASPPRSPRCSGEAAHAGHLILAFTRPEEQRLADQLGVSGRLDPVRSDAVAVTTSNFGRQQDRLLPQPRRSTTACMVTPNDATAPTRAAHADLSVALDNTAPADGPPADRDRSVPARPVRRRREPHAAVDVLAAAVRVRRPSTAARPRSHPGASAAATCTR